MSFFERLTGTIDLDDDGDDEEQAETQQGASSDAGKEYGAEKAGAQERGIAELSVDVYQTADEIVIQTMVAGVKPGDLDISITREMVTIEGRREGPHVDDDDYYYQELYWGPFMRKIILPSEVEVEDAEAIEQHGLVIIKLPKIDKDRAAKLKVKSQ